MEYAPALSQEEVLDTLELPELSIDHAVLYHGSHVPGTAVFDLAKSEEATVGQGVYLTSSPNDAAGYARRRYENRGRHNNDSAPVVYQVEVDHLKLANLDNEEMLAQVLSGFASVLEAKLPHLTEDVNLPWWLPDNYRRTIETIRRGEVAPGNVRLVAFAHSKRFTQYLQSLGCDGLRATEGGEPPHVGSHDTYVIFDPDQAKITGECDLTA